MGPARRGKGTVVFLEYDPARNGYLSVIGAAHTANREATKMLLLPSGHGLVSVSALAPGDNNGLYDVAFVPGGRIFRRNPRNNSSRKLPTVPEWRIRKSTFRLCASSSSDRLERCLSDSEM
jgi:hypothetical protein